MGKLGEKRQVHVGVEQRKYRDEGSTENMLFNKGKIG